MLVIGIVGGIASGKSTISQLFEELGAVLLDADKAGHLVLQDPAVIGELKTRWGSEVLTPSGQINRSTVAKLVFGESPQSREELAFLESVTHPRIEERIRKQIRTLEHEGAAAVILDAPLLIKAGWDQFCDAVVFVDAPDELRWKRASQRGWTRKQYESRETSQTPIEIKRERATHVLSNTGSLEETAEDVRRIWRSLVDIPSNDR